MATGELRPKPGKTRKPSHYSEAERLLEIGAGLMSTGSNEMAELMFKQAHVHAMLAVADGNRGTGISAAANGGPMQVTGGSLPPVPPDVRGTLGLLRNEF